MNASRLPLSSPTRIQAKNKNQLLASQKQELQQENEELVAKYQQRSKWV